MAAREPENGVRKSSRNDNIISNENESENRPEKDEKRRKWDVGNYWGFSLEGIFGLALKFFKEMNGKAFNPTYEENLLFVALQKQILLGPYNPKSCPEIGFFDVLGNDRRKKWAELGSTAKEDAMEEFVKLLYNCCSLFSAYVTSHKIEKEEHERKLREEEERHRPESEERHGKEEEQEKKRQESDCFLNTQQKQQMTVALNAQTPVQFQQNAEGQTSKSSDQQQQLIQQPQETHYQECIQQAHHTHQVKQDKAEAPSPASNDMASITNPINHTDSSQREMSDSNPKQCHLFVESNPGEFPIMAPSMWTTPQVNEFKAKTKQDAESVITVGRGEVLTVHIPTHADGSMFFWEFATDYHDIAFGLYFEWPDTVNGVGTEKFVESVSEKTETGQAEEANLKSDKKTGSVVPRVSEVVPLFRRDSHENVYAGSHQYPSQGVYLLRFDNSYSLWRPKVVYYRVYYTSQIY
ncbi:Golgi resident protein GCP60 [Tachysurus vachellii]|uniref:Golgi resident protein GCP60 n=1 Tax=Tachysurus vachellii TaxID=175792 RepID=UPI00296B1F44|nr:Golgi resident protein GCP60 [Tachysurus vachellii]